MKEVKCMMVEILWMIDVVQNIRKYVSIFIADASARGYAVLNT